MKQYLQMKWIVLVLLMAVVSACGERSVSFSTANLQNPVLARDEAGSDVTTVFAQEDTIYVLADLHNAPDSTTVRAVFTAVDAEGEAPDTKIDEGDLTTGSGLVTFNLTPSGLWPGGSYKVELYLNDELDQTLTYRVEGPVATQTDDDSQTAEATPDSSSEIAATPALSGAVSTVEDARSAVIQIQAEGTFVEPEGVSFNMAGRGSGFIIDPSGIAVTNNHVVTGAALIKVWLDGENQSRNARLIATSECSDLAVIAIDGADFPYLDWYENQIRVGSEVYVAGFPLGDPEYTLTRGIVSKENADGESNWASVNHVIEYDAQATGGNSGGPVINSNAEVVAVHYASSLQTTGQAFGIGADIAQGIVEQLRAGMDVHSIGINGRAIMSEDGAIFGLWVSSVKSGSLADQAGIRPGDLLRQLEGLVLATDGTMADYCDILRSRGPEDTLSFSLWRLNSGEILEGQINGREATVVSTLRDDSNQTIETSEHSSASSYSDYISVQDDFGQLVVAVPSAWSQLDSSPWVNDEGEQLGPQIIVSPDINSFLGSWSVPGVRYRASSELGISAVELIDLFDYSGNCQYDGRQAYSDAIFTGQYDVWVNCGDSGSTFVVLTAAPESNAYLIMLEVQILSDADVEAFQNILDSFNVQ